MPLHQVPSRQDNCIITFDVEGDLCYVVTLWPIVVVERQAYQRHEAECWLIHHVHEHVRTKQLRHHRPGKLHVVIV